MRSSSPRCSLGAETDRSATAVESGRVEMEQVMVVVVMMAVVVLAGGCESARGGRAVD